MSYSRRSKYRSPSFPPDQRGRSLSRSLSRSISRSRSRESSDVENPGNNLYVIGLSSRITKKELEKHFASEGEVTDAHLVMDPWTRETRGFGFVTMTTLDWEDANRCIKYLDGSVLEGQVITVEKARRRHGRTPTPGRYLGQRTANAGRGHSPSYSPYYRSRHSSPGYSSSEDRSHSPYYRRHRSRLHSPYYWRRRSRSYSPYYNTGGGGPGLGLLIVATAGHQAGGATSSPPVTQGPTLLQCRPTIADINIGFTRPITKRRSISPLARRRSRRNYPPSVSPRPRRSRRSYSHSVSPEVSRSRRSYLSSLSPGIRTGYSRSYSPMGKRSRRSSSSSCGPSPGRSKRRYSRESNAHCHCVGSRSVSSSPVRSGYRSVVLIIIP